MLKFCYPHVIQNLRIVAVCYLTLPFKLDAMLRTTCHMIDRIYQLNGFKSLCW